MHKRYWTRGLVASLAVLGLTVSLSSSGIAGAKTTSGTSFLPPSLKGPAPASVNISTTAGFQLVWLPVFLAFGLGYYQQVATRFHTTIANDPQPTSVGGEAAFLAGADQFGDLSVSNFLPPILGGRDQVAIFAPDISLVGAMIALTKYKAAYGSDVSKFTGSWCETSNTGTAGIIPSMEVALNHMSLTQSNFTNLGGPVSVLPTLQSGQCQITSADAGSAITGAVNGTTYVVQNLIGPLPAINLVGEYLPVSLTVSHAFAGQYRKLTQAVVDATLKGLLYLQANIKNPQRLYAHLPVAMQNAVSLGVFTQSMLYYAQGYTATFDSGMFTKRAISDTLLAAESTKVVPIGTAINPSQVFTDKYVFQAYQDLGVKLPTGPTAGVLKVPTTLGKPTAEAATAFALLTGGGLPANTGIDPLSKIKG